MAFTGNYVCNNFKLGLAKAVHDFTASTGHVFRIALYTSSATMNAGTGSYTTSGEVATGGGYTASGAVLPVASGMPVLSGSTVMIDFNDALWAASTITARGAMIYNDTASGDPSVVIIDFGVDKSSNVGDFSIIFPSASVTRAVIRIV
jgi:hypothetical protein